jgi:hypothetical protein
MDFTVKDLQPITELCLCEQNHLVLKPDTLYMFTTDEDCPACMKIYKTYVDDAIKQKHEEEKWEAQAWQDRVDDVLSTWKTLEEIQAALDIDEDAAVALVYGVDRKNIEAKFPVGRVAGELAFREVKNESEQDIPDGRQVWDQPESGEEHESEILEAGVVFPACGICENRLQCNFALDVKDCTGHSVPSKPQCVKAVLEQQWD